MKLLSPIGDLLASCTICSWSPILKFILSVLSDPSARDLYKRIV